MMMCACGLAPSPAARTAAAHAAAVVASLARVLIGGRALLARAVRWIAGTNFVLISAVYIFVSFRVFHITAALRDVAVPKEGGTALVKRAALIGAGFVVLYTAGMMLKSLQPTYFPIVRAGPTGPPSFTTG